MVAQDRQLLSLARQAGILAHWTDAYGGKRVVGLDTIRAVLEAMALPCHSLAAIKASTRQLQRTRSQLPPLVVCTPGEKIRIGERATRGIWVFEDATEQNVRFSQTSSGEAYAIVGDRPGYHTLLFGRHQLRIAVAPRRLSSPTSKNLWGLAAQIYSLPGGTTAEFGDFAALAEFCEYAAKSGAAAVGMSPVHALLPGSLENYSPYAPSSRQFLNPLFAAVGPQKQPRSTAGLIDWTNAYRRKLAALRVSYRSFTRSSRDKDEFVRFVAENGQRLLRHARFEVLHTRMLTQGRRDWRDWPEEFRHPDGASVQKMRATDPEVEFRLYLQWLADKDLREAQARATRAGMTIGLIADLAIGIDPQGSDAWSNQSEILSRLTIGAPPDQLGPDGQNWGLTTFSPRALQESAFDAYVATLRSAMSQTGGVRIDHAMGFQRLWVIPQGASSQFGAYLHYPIDALMSLAVLEAHRRRAVVIAEDLGTVPRGFRRRLADRGVNGMRVLRFERDRTGDFKSPQAWDRQACAMTSTHDLPTIAGWWSGRDLDWRARLSRPLQGNAARRGENQERDHDRKRLWKALKKERCVEGSKPSRTKTADIVDGVLRFVARSRSRTALFPLEDVVGAIEQPNIPGTVDTHPNWRRRLSSSAIKSGRTRARLALIAEERNGTRPGHRKRRKQQF